MLNPLILNNKRILLAGIHHETGRTVARQLSELGAEIVIIDTIIDNEENFSISEIAGNYKQHYFDIYENNEIEKNLNSLIKEYGSYHGFVYCAGIGGVRPLSMTKNTFIHEMMNANLYSFIEMCRILSKKNNMESGGSIVAISSVSSIRGLKSKTSYCASKAALDAAIRCIALELADKKIRVNSILKGWVSSDMNLDFIKNNMNLNENEDFKKQVLGATEPIEIANTVAFLLSDATKTITGTSLLIDGGYTL